jgi:peptidoglycan/LPS O-acetylase OafA/YrhL
MHALTMLVYGVAILFFCNTSETLIYFTSILFFFYAFSEIIFCNWLLNLENKVVYQIVLIRILLGVMVGIGTIVIMNYYDINEVMALVGYGVLFIIIGINILLYVPIMRKTESKVFSNNPYDSPPFIKLSKKGNNATVKLNTNDVKKQQS